MNHAILILDLYNLYSMMDRGIEEYTAHESASEIIQILLGYLDDYYKNLREKANQNQIKIVDVEELRRTLQILRQILDRIEYISTNRLRKNLSQEISNIESKLPELEAKAYIAEIDEKYGYLKKHSSIYDFQQLQDLIQDAKSFFGQHIKDKKIQTLSQRVLEIEKQLFPLGIRVYFKTIDLWYRDIDKDTPKNVYDENVRELRQYLEQAKKFLSSNTDGDQYRREVELLSSKISDIEKRLSRIDNEILKK